MKLLQKNSKPEVYSISGFRDTLASPVFYPVVVVSLVLGIASIFGLVQNPLKLKAMVNVIHQKVSETKIVRGSIDDQLYTLADNVEPETVLHKQSTRVIELFSNLNEMKPTKMSVEGDFERVAFNYDVTSERFWSDLDSSNFESASEEMERKEREATTFGVPLEVDYADDLPSEFNSKDDSIYALNKLSKI
ncbi:MAG: hypothetical protein V7749_04590 [Cocleimonas sp.]